VALTEAEKLALAERRISLHEAERDAILDKTNALSQLDSQLEAGLARQELWLEAGRKQLEIFKEEEEKIKAKIVIEHTEGRTTAALTLKLQLQQQATEALTVSIERSTEGYKKLAKQTEKALNIADDFVGKMSAVLGIQKDFSETLSGSVFELFKTGKGLSALGEKFKKMKDPMNIMGSMMDVIVKQSIALTQAQDAASASFAQAGGNVSRYNDDINNLEKSFNQHGITIEEAADSMFALQSSFVNLRKESKSSQTDMLKTTSILSEMGVDANTTSSNMQTMTAALGFTAKQAAQTQRELFVLARTIDMPPDQMAKAFGDAMPKLAAFGKESTDVFKRLQVNARAAGMEVSDVLSITEQFDKFDTAASSVGRLNAILGGPYLNSLEMVTTTDPAERMKMLSAAVNEAGVSFDQMDYYQRKALASTLGVDVQQLALMMRDGFDSAVPGAQKSQAELAALAESAKEFQTIMDELRQTGRLLATSLKPLLMMIKGMLNNFQWLVNLSPKVAEALPLVASGIMMVAMAVKFFGTSLTFSKMGTILFVVSAIIAFMTIFSEASNPVKVAIIAIAVVVGILGIAIWNVTTATAAFNVMTGGLLPVLAGVAAAVITIASIFLYSAGSPGFITILDMVSSAVMLLGKALFFPITMFNSLASAVMSAAKAIFGLDGAKASVSTTTTSTASTRPGASNVTATTPTVGATAMSAPKTTVTATDANGRIQGARQEGTTAAAAGSRTASASAAGASAVNVKIGASDNFFKVVTDIVKETNNYEAQGRKPKPNVIRSKIA